MDVSGHLTFIREQLRSWSLTHCPEHRSTFKSQPGRLLKSIEVFRIFFFMLFALTCGDAVLFKALNIALILIEGLFAYFFFS